VPVEERLVRNEVMVRAINERIRELPERFEGKLPDVVEAVLREWPEGAAE
jgi:hypothetical protein